jgi:hypothetical protein
MTITNHDKSKTHHGHCQQPIPKLTNTAPRFQSSSFYCITSKPQISGVLNDSTPHSIDRRLLISKHSLSLQSVEYKTPGANLFTAVSKCIDPVDPAPYAQHRRQVNNKTSTINTPSAYCNSLPANQSHVPATTTTACFENPQMHSHLISSFQRNHEIHCICFQVQHSRSPLSHDSAATERSAKTDEVMQSSAIRRIHLIGKGKFKSLGRNGDDEMVSIGEGGVHISLDISTSVRSSSMRSKSACDMWRTLYLRPEAVLSTERSMALACPSPASSKTPTTSPPSAERKKKSRNAERIDRETVSTEEKERQRGELANGQDLVRGALGFSLTRCR